MRNSIVFSALFVASAAFGGQPTAPTQLCIDDDCVTTAPAPQVSGKKWHPGHYLKTQGPFYSIDQGSYVGGVIKTLPRVLESEKLQGAYVDFAWGALNPTGTTYYWKDLDEVLNWLCSRDKVLILSVGYKHFAGPKGSELIMPADLIEKGHAVSTKSGMIAAIWRPEVMSRFIGTMQEVARRYDANRCLEMVTTSESSPSFGDISPPGDYSIDAMGIQLQRLYDAQSKAFQRTSVAAQINFLGNEAASLIEGAYNAGLGRAGPDAFDDTGTKIFRGEQVKGAGTTVRDYRVRVPHHAVVSSPVLGGKDDNGPPAKILEWAQFNKVTHLSWISTSPNSPNTWGEIKEVLNTYSALHSGCPTSYRDCVTR